MEKVSFREILFLLKISRHLHMLFAAITHLVEGLSLDTLIIIIIIIIIIIYLFTCLLISPKAKYRVSTNKRRNKNTYS
jgi:hypothetical protein